MEKVKTLFVIAVLMAGLVSCNRLPKLSELKETVNDVKKTVEVAKQVYSEDPESYWEEEQLVEEIPAYNDFQYDLRGYEWLKGVWAGAEGCYTYGRMIIDDYGVKVVNSNMDDPFAKVEEMEPLIIELGTRRDYITGEGDGYIFGFDDYIGVDPMNRSVYILQGEFNGITLHKISNDITEEAIFKANHNYPPRVYSNAYDGFVNIRQNADGNSPILGVLNNGPEGAVLLSREGDWTKVRLYGTEGYVASRFTQDTPTEVFVADKMTAKKEDTKKKTVELKVVDTPEEYVAEQVAEEPVEAEIFTIVEEMPEFPGGMAKLSEYLAKNIQYPQMARETGIKGRVFVGFVVEPDGSVSNVKVIRGIGGGCDEEAVRVVKSMPKWKPGKQRGKAVRVSYNLPVNFQLQ